MLRACFDPCFRLMLGLPGDAGREGIALRHEARRLLDEAECRARSLHEAASVETARRMVEAWMDEQALSRPWPGRTDWLRSPLQARWQAGRRGGDWFFEASRRLSPDLPGNAAVAAVALRCLAFGFQGHFHNDPDGLHREHRALAARFAFQAIPVAFPPDPVLPSDSRLFRAAAPLLGLAAVALLAAFWGLHEHGLRRSFAKTQDVFAAATHEVRGHFRLPSNTDSRPALAPERPASPSGRQP